MVILLVLMQVSFLRTWFAENNVNEFSIAVWFQRKGELDPKAAIVNNKNCEQGAGFSLATDDTKVTASITTDVEVSVIPATVSTCANDIAALVAIDYRQREAAYLAIRSLCGGASLWHAIANQKC